MKCIILFVSLIVFAIGDSDLTFKQWHTKHKIRFTSLRDRARREKIFQDMKNEIEAHNADPQNTYTKALNKFSHLTSDEFISTKCGTRLPERLANGGLTHKNADFLHNDTFFEGFDYGIVGRSIDIQKTEITENPSYRVTYPFGSFTSSNSPVSTNFSSYVQPIVDQGACGACWAFASMAQLEGILKIRNSEFNIHLSPQFSIDCDIGNDGCNGGWPTDALLWLKFSFGGGNKAPTSLAYPYRGVKGMCNKKLSTISLGISKIKEIYVEGNEQLLKSFIANYGPIIVAIDASGAFQSYNSGVIYDTTCSSGTICEAFNHAVLAVGYGTDETFGDYWLVKNSWGSQWGENGYVRMARNRDNNCNIACYAIFTY